MLMISKNRNLKVASGKQELGGVFLRDQQKKSSVGLQSKQAAGPQEEVQL